MAREDVIAGNDPKPRCVFLARYRKIGVNQWIRTGGPEIDILEEPWPDIYRNPQVLTSRKNEAEVRVKDDSAVDLEEDSLLGDHEEAAKRCNQALLQAFPGDVIVDSLSS